MKVSHKDCNQCKNLFRGSYELDNHIKSKHGAQYDICKEIFVVDSYLKEHMNKHNKTR